MRRHAADRLLKLRLGIGAGSADQLDQQLERADKPLGTAALEGQLAGHLPPTLAFAPDQPLGRHEHPVEHDLVEVVFAGEVDDRPDRDTRRFEIEDQLAEPAVAVGLGGRGAHERDCEMRLVRVTRPDLSARDLVPASDRDRPGPKR